MNISVLKLDIEGEEFNSMPEILASNMFERINQLHLEVLETSINLKVVLLRNMMSNIVVARRVTNFMF